MAMADAAEADAPVPTEPEPESPAVDSEQPTQIVRPDDEQQAANGTTTAHLQAEERSEP
jgi:hypothetical protein